MKRVQLNLRIDEKTKDLLDMANFALRKSKSEIVREAITEYVQNKRSESEMLEAITEKITPQSRVGSGSE